jgi:hypothetical protein
MAKMVWVTLPLLFLAAWPALADPPVQVVHAGDPLADGCRLNFVWSNYLAGTRWIGTAASCVELGQVVSTPFMPIFGDVFYVGDRDGQETNGIAGLQLDFALIQPRPGVELHPHFRGTNMPSYHPSEVRPGDLVLLPGATSHSATRTGVFLSWEWPTFGFVAPVGPEDIGAPVLNVPSGITPSSGQEGELGVFTRIGVPCCPFGALYEPFTGIGIGAIEHELYGLGLRASVETVPPGTA